MNNNKFEINQALFAVLSTIAERGPIVVNPTTSTEVAPAVALEEPPAVIELQEEVRVEKPMSDFKRNKIRLMNALEITLALAEQVDFNEGESMRVRMLRGAYPNAFLKDITTMGRLKQLFNFIQWSEVTARCSSETVTVLQASLPKQVIAYAPWAQLDELASIEGGLASVRVRTDERGELYLASHLRVQTKYVTATLLNDGSGVERLLAWFPGREISSTLKDGLKTQVIRTNWK
jgi:uncharacterized membrane protein